MAETRSRLDALLVTRGLASTRSRAADAIKRGTVRVDGIKAVKPGQRVANEADIKIADPAAGLASRGGLKLIAALDAFEVEVVGLSCLDLGASTGGFTDVLIKRGAAHVTAIDVGHGQFSRELAANPNVTCYEKLDARKLTMDHLNAAPQLLVADLSFIGLAKALPAAVALAAPGAILISLIKPQFEAGPADVGKGGIVRNEAVQARVCDEVSQWLTENSWSIEGLIPSPIEGGSGNREFLICARKKAGVSP